MENEKTVLHLDDGKIVEIDHEEERIAKMGRLLTKANILQAFVNIALDYAELSYDGTPYMIDNGKSVLLLISAFFEEEYGFRIAQLKAECDEKKKGDKA